MEILKYPVEGLYGKYYVDVDNPHVCFGLHEWNVTIYTYNPNKMFKKYKKVHEFTSGWNHYAEYIGKYVELISAAVKSYEDEIDKSNEETAKYVEGIISFKLWDGKILSEK